MPSTILNREILALLERIGPLQTIVIADRGFPFWPNLQTIDLSLVDGIPRVRDVLLALHEERNVSHIWIAEEFYTVNDPASREPLKSFLAGFPVTREPHEEFKRRVPAAIALIRTADTLQYSNLVLQIS